MLTCILFSHCTTIKNTIVCLTILLKEKVDLDSILQYKHNIGLATLLKAILSLQLHCCMYLGFDNAMQCFCNKIIDDFVIFNTVATRLFFVISTFYGYFSHERSLYGHKAFKLSTVEHFYSANFYIARPWFGSQIDIRLICSTPL